MAQGYVLSFPYTTLFRSIERFVRCVALMKQPLEQLVVGQPGNRLFVSDPRGERNRDACIAAGKLSNRPGINLREVGEALADELLNKLRGGGFECEDLSSFRFV